jgi:hypothetical protein
MCWQHAEPFIRYVLYEHVLPFVFLSSPSCLPENCIMETSDCRVFAKCVNDDGRFTSVSLMAVDSECKNIFIIFCLYVLSASDWSIA